MTESEWLAYSDPQPMLEFLYENASNRKLRLFGVACCRRTLGILTNGSSRLAIEVAERYADGMASEQEFRAASQAASEAAGLGRFGGDDSWGRDSFAAGLEYTAKAAAWAATWSHVGGVELCNAAATAAVPTWADRAEEFTAQAPPRDILGNPFRPINLNPAWLTPAVVSLAQAAYENRNLPSGTLDTARLAILADALEDAGCDNADILTHCRSEGPHVRGCWVVDLLLGRE